MKCELICEAGLYHEGSLAVALNLIENAASAGADTVKFQIHIAESESSQFEKFRTNGFVQDSSRYDYWERTSFSKAEWMIIKKHCENSGVNFLASAFSIEALDLLVDLGCKRVKLSSGEIFNDQLIYKSFNVMEEVIVSTGMSSWADLDEFNRKMEPFKQTCKITVLHCQSQYPVGQESADIIGMKRLKEKFGWRVGLSDHSGTIYPGIAAAVLGAEIIEVHCCYSKKSFGPDVSASLTFEDLELLSQGILFIDKSIQLGCSRDKNSKLVQDVKKLFTKGAYAAMDVPEGTELDNKHVQFLKPAASFSPSDLDNMVGKKLTKKLIGGDPILPENFE